MGVAANVLNKQSWTTDMGCPYSLGGGLGEELTPHNLRKDRHITRRYTESQAVTVAWNDPRNGKRASGVEHCVSGVLCRSSSLLIFVRECAKCKLGGCSYKGGNVPTDYTFYLWLG